MSDLIHKTQIINKKQQTKTETKKDVLIVNK